MDKKKSLLSAENIMVLALAFIALAVTTIAVIPSLRKPVKDFFVPEQRTILAKVSGDLTGKGMKVTILKIQQKESLILEIYSEDLEGSSELISKITLPERRDGYFQLRGNATNLGLSDVDKDGTLEILAPAFDEQMVARLNIYKFHSDSRTFERINTAPNTEF